MDEEPSSGKREDDSWADGFSPQEGDDLVIVTSDEVNFSVRAMDLKVCSTVFADMLSMEEKETGEKVGGRPVLRISEEANVATDTFFRYAQMNRPGRLLREGRYRPFCDVSEVQELMGLCDKYNTTMLARTALGELLPDLLPTAKEWTEPLSRDADPSPALVFALASLYHLEAVAAAAIRAHEYRPSYPWPEGKGPTQPGERQRTAGLEDVPNGIIAKMDPRVIAGYSGVRTRAMEDPKTTWADAANDFLVSPVGAKAKHSVTADADPVPCDDSKLQSYAVRLTRTTTRPTRGPRSMDGTTDCVSGEVGSVQS